MAVPDRWPTLAKLGASLRLSKPKFPGGVDDGLQLGPLQAVGLDPG
jgi:hypothetical protein